MLSLLQEDFEEYAEKAKTLPESTSNENKLILYGLFKQATVGDVNTCKDTQYSLITTQLIFLSVFFTSTENSWFKSHDSILRLPWVGCNSVPS
jgi:hypothetical protein